MVVAVVVVGREVGQIVPGLVLEVSVSIQRAGVEN